MGGAGSILYRFTVVGAVSHAIYVRDTLQRTKIIAITGYCMVVRFLSVLALVLFAAPLCAAPGDLDTSFQGGGDE